MKLKSLKKIAQSLATLSFAIAVFGSFLPVAYAIDYVPLAPIKETIKSGGGTDLPTYLTGMFKVGIAAAGVLAFLVIVWGGFTYLSTDAFTGKEEGKERIKRAVGGLILALGAYIILRTINPSLVTLDLNFGGKLDAKGGLNAPAWVVSNANDLEELRAKHTEDIAKSIAALEEKEANHTLTPAEEQELKEDRIIRTANDSINTIYSYEKRAINALYGSWSFAVNQIKDSQAILDDMKTEMDIRVKELKDSGATDKQIKVVTDRFNAESTHITNCFQYRREYSWIKGKDDPFRVYCPYKE